MKYVLPQDITYEFADTNVPEDTLWSDGSTPLLEWVSGTTYTTSSEVKVAANKAKYLCTYAIATVSTISPELDPENWVEAPLNAFAMIDASSTSITSNPASIEMHFSVSNVDTIALFNVLATQIEINLKHNILTTELMGTGDGVETTFTHTSAVVPFEGFVEVWVNGVKEAEDSNGDGILEDVIGSYTLSSGTVNYTTGAVSATFSTAPANTLDVELRYNAKLFSVSQDMTYDDLETFGDYLFTEQELSDALNTHVAQSTIDNVIASMTEDQINTQFTADPPIYYDVDVYINIINIGGTAECGYLVTGRKRDLGTSLYGGSIGLKTTASRDRDLWGNVKLSTGTTYNTMDVPVHILANQVDIVKNRLYKIMNVPCLFVGDDSDVATYQSMTIYGFYFDLEAPIDRVKTDYNLRIESLL